MPINLTSPVAKIPFGKFKGMLFWEAPLTWYQWLMTEEITDHTVDTITSALRMKEEENNWAVIRKSKKTKFLFILKSIHTQQIFAEAACKSDDDWSDYVYHIVKSLDEKNKVS